MARKLRVEYEGAIYHVMNRGDRREPIFIDDQDQEVFLETLGQACAKTGWQVHSYCLMPNHFHLVVETPRANLVAGMKWFLGTYTARFNRRHRLSGHLFSGRYKSLVVDGSGTGYLRSVCDYVHLNPVRARMLGAKGSLRSYRWSSFGYYLAPKRKRPAWLRVDRVFGECGLGQDRGSDRHRFEARMEARRWEGEEEMWKKIRRGWYLGDKKFRKELLEEVVKQGAENAEAEEARAERICVEALKKEGLRQKGLKQLPKGDERKVRAAQRLRKETAMSMRWICQRLEMGVPGHLANLLTQQKVKK